MPGHVAHRFAEEDRPKASEAMQLFKEANRMLNELDAAYQTHGVVNIMDANADRDDLLLNSKRFRFCVNKQQN